MNNRIHNKDSNTEMRILQAASEVFRKKGMEGARMQEIADVAGINKALLHYYFRSKEKLFSTIFEKEFGEFFPQMQMLFAKDKPVTEKIVSLIDSYIDLLTANPFLPQFIIVEINRNPQFVVDKFDKMARHIVHTNLQQLAKQMKEEEAKGLIRPMDPRHLITSLISMCLFPFLAKPLLKPILFEDDEKKYNKYLKERKALVKQIILDSLKP